MTVTILQIISDRILFFAAGIAFVGLLLLVWSLYDSYKIDGE